MRSLTDHKQRSLVPSRPSIPRQILETEHLLNRLTVKLTEALVHHMTESDWKKLATLHDLSDRITHHDRFLRSLYWSDPDHEGHVLDLVQFLMRRRQDVVVELFERPDIRAWFKRKEPELIELWDHESDPLVTALVHGLNEVDAVADNIDLGQYTKRLAASLESDPYQTIGTTKDMLEATMRTILHRRGIRDLNRLDFPALTTRTLVALDLQQGSPPSTQSARLLAKMVSSAKRMLETANELRNEIGTGHGRVVGNEQGFAAADASLVASCGLVLAAWLMRHDQRA